MRGQIAVGFEFAEEQQHLRIPDDIYAETVEGSGFASTLPMSEAEFRGTPNPVAIVRNRRTVGGPQPAEMDRMLKESSQRIARQDDWIKARRGQISSSLSQLDADFEKLGAGR